MHAHDGDARVCHRRHLLQAAFDRAIDRREAVADVEGRRVATGGDEALSQGGDGSGLLRERHPEAAVQYPAVAQVHDASNLARRELAAEPHGDPFTRTWPRLTEHAVEVD